MNWTLSKIELGLAASVCTIMAIIAWYSSNLGGVRRVTSVLTATVAAFIGFYAVTRLGRRIAA